MIAIIGGDPDAWGFIPGFLDENDPRPAKEQINERYLGGWLHHPGGSLDLATMTYQYPEDPPMQPISALTFRNEVLFLFPGDFVAIMQTDGTWEMSRLD